MKCLGWTGLGKQTPPDKGAAKLASNCPVSCCSYLLLAKSVLAGSGGKTTRLPSPATTNFIHLTENKTLSSPLSIGQSVSQSSVVSLLLKGQNEFYWW